MTKRPTAISGFTATSGFLGALTARERRNVAVQSLADGVLGLCLWGVSAPVLSTFGVALARQIPVETSVSLVRALWLGLGFLIVALCTVRAVRRWRRAGDLVRQAALAQAVEPAFRGRLVLLAEHEQGAQYGASPALIALAERRALAIASTVSPAAVHTGEQSHPALLRGGVGLLALVAVSLLIPAGLSNVVASLFTDPEPVRTAEVTLDPQRVVLGDIVLEYRYPAYLGLESLRVENSTGDIHAPPGTRVQIYARTAELFETAVLVATSPEGEARSEVVVREGRDLSCGLEVFGVGSWKIVFPAVAGDRASAEHAIEPDRDLAPEVVVEAPSDRLEVAYDQQLPISWTVRDDFGVLRVEAALSSAVCTEGDCAVSGPGRKLLREPLDPVRQLTGRSGFTPADLGLLPGQERSVVIAAYDNDAVAGPKVGLSRRIVIRVLGPRGKQTRRARMIRGLRERLLVVLADFLVESWPVSGDQASLSRWAGRVVERMEPIEALTEAYWDGFTPETFEGTAVLEVQRTTTALLGFVLEVGREGAARGPSQRDRVTLDGLRADVIVSIEQAVLILDRVLRLQALNKVGELASSVAQRSAQMAQPRVASAAARLAELDRLERQLRQLSRAVEDLGRGEMAEFLMRRSRDALALSQELRKVLGASKTAAATELTSRLARELAQMAQTVDDMRAAAQEEADEMAARARDLAAELEQLEAEERDLADETQSLRDRHMADHTDWADEWAELVAQAEALLERLETVSAAVTAESRRTGGEKSRVADATEGASGLLDAMNAANAVTALQRSMGLERRLGSLSTIMETYSMARRARGETVLSGDAQARSEIRSSVREATAIRRSLERLDDRVDRLPSEALATADGLARDQAVLQDRAEGLAEEAAELAPNFPMGAPGLEEGIAAAVDEMDRADAALDGGRLVEGETGQRAAADRLADARRAIERAMRDAQQMAQMAAGESSGEGDEQSDPGGRREGREMHAEMMEIPAPEEFQTPEAYRKALLEGMEGDVPEEFEALKRRYYEELVLQ